MELKLELLSISSTHSAARYFSSSPATSSKKKNKETKQEGSAAERYDAITGG